MDVKITDGPTQSSSGSRFIFIDAPDGYEIVKEEDQNTDQGDEFIPQVPPAPCVGAMHLVEDDRNPANGTDTPLCDRRLVTLQDQQNAAADFRFNGGCGNTLYLGRIVLRGSAAMPARALGPAGLWA